MELRECSYPLDWVVSFGGVSKLFEKKFENFIPDNDPSKNYFYQNGDNFPWSKEYDIMFRHDSFPESTEKYEHRISRLLQMLDTTAERVLFIRKCHPDSHHEEVAHQNILYENDIQDVLDFEKALNKNFPNLSYHIVFMLLCNRCYSNKTIMKNELSKNISVYNISQFAKNDVPVIKDIITKELESISQSGCDPSA